MKRRLAIGPRILQQLPWILYGGIVLAFSLRSPRFLSLDNFVNIFVQSASTAIAAIGMTFVLLAAGVDLSVGAAMFVGAAVAAKLVLAGWGVGWAVAAFVVIGAAFGALNALLVARLRILSFIATLAMLHLGRGFALWITETRAMNLPDEFLAIGSARFLGVPLPIWICGAVLLAAHAALTMTPFGRQVYAVGRDAEAARKAGIDVRRIVSATFVVSGCCAGLAGLVSLGQLGAVSPTFGEEKEFAAIAAAVLGGTSLFGGRGRVFPGTILGAVMIQTVESGLVIAKSDPYLYPLVTGAVIFSAVLIDSVRHAWLARLARRKIRIDVDLDPSAGLSSLRA